MNHAKAEHIQGAEILRTIVHKIPTYNQAVVSSMSFSPKTEGNLIIVYANHHFIEVDNINGKYTEFTNKITRRRALRFLKSKGSLPIHVGFNFGF